MIKVKPIHVSITGEWHCCHLQPLGYMIGGIKALIWLPGMRQEICLQETDDILECIITVASHEHHIISKYRQIDCLFNNLFRTSIKAFCPWLKVWLCVVTSLLMHCLALGYPCSVTRPGGRFKNTYELLNLRALKISKLLKKYIFQFMGKIFCVEF